MGQDKENTAEPYNFDLAFERQVVLLACSSPRFWGRVGDALEPDAFALVPSRMAIGAAKAISKDSGRGPEDPSIVLQRLRRWMSQGQVTLEQIHAVGDQLELAEDAGVLSEDAVVDEIRPVLQRRAQMEAVRAATDTFSKRGDFSTVMRMLERSAQIGGQDVSVGTKLGSASFDIIDRVRHLQRLPTGVGELDLALDGGLMRGGEFVWLAPTGAGKSMALAHQAGTAMRCGMFVGYATMELPEPLVFARIVANVTGVPINAVLDGARDEAARRLDAMQATLGSCLVKEFTPHATTVEDLKEWVARCEDVEGRPMDALVVDYADKMVAPKEKSEYSSARVVYEGLRVFAQERGKWVHTASQAKGQGKDAGKKKLDVDQAADSMHKGRVCDVMVSLNVTGEGDDRMVEYFVAKHRTGKSRMCVGPIPADFACARIAPLARLY